MSAYPITVPVSGTPTLIYTPAASGTPTLFVQNVGRSIVYIGGAGATQSGGIPLAPNQAIDLAYAPTALYAVCGFTPTATATTTTAAVSSGSAVSTAITSGSGTVNGQYVQLGSGTASETTTITSGGGTTTLTLAQLLDDHKSGAALTVVTPMPSVLTVAPGAY
jgi:hypothetical protein